MSDIKRAFVTGSHAYGIPKPSSDIDLVVFVTDSDLALLQAASQKQGEYGPDIDLSLVFGGLNLLCFTDEKKYDAWLAGNKHLKKQAPVTREFAVKCLDKFLGR